MFRINENYLKLPGSYLFSTIGKKVNAYSAAHPDKKIIRLGIGDVTQPLVPAIIDAMHSAVDEMGKAETFRGYAPDLGYEFLRNAIADNDYKARGCDISADEIASSVFAFDPTVGATDANSAPNAFLSANEEFNDGIPEIGAFTVPADERQGFITPQLNKLLKSQYLQNASEASARILATGFINPFTQSESARIDSRTGMCGMYDDVDCFMFNKVTRQFVYVALGIAGTSNDAAADLAACRASLDKIGAIIVYGAGTCRGIVGPTVEANPNTYYGGVYILPKMKVGVECLHGATIKMVINAGAGATSGWSAADIAKMMNTLTFTPIDGVTIKGNVAGFNDGTTN